MYCPKCGTVQMAGSPVCVKCGAVTSQPGGQSLPPPFPTSMPPPPPWAGMPGQPGMPPMYGNVPMMPPPNPYSGLPASGRSITALCLGIGSFVFGGPLLSIPGLILGKMELKSIREGGASPQGETYAKVGYILSLINLILVGLALLAFGLCMAILMSAK